MSGLTAEFTGVRQVRIDDFGTGSITVEPGTREDVVEAAVDAADEELLQAVQLRQDGSWLRIDFPPMRWRRGDASVRLAVPPGLGYAIRAGAADIAFRAEIGPTRITNGSGDITVQTATDLEATTGSGHVVADRLQGRGAKISSGTGEISVAEAYCPLSAKSGSGDISVQALHHAALQASSGSGDIAVPAATGSVDLRTASGSLRIGVADGLSAWLDLGSVSGDVSIELDSTSEPAPGEAYISVRARTASGDISVFRA